MTPVRDYRQIGQPVSDYVDATLSIDTIRDWTGTHVYWKLLDDNGVQFAGGYCTSHMDALRHARRWGIDNGFPHMNLLPERAKK